MVDEGKQPLSADIESLPVVSGVDDISVKVKRSALMPLVGLDHRSYTTFDKIKALELLWEHPQNIALICRGLGVSRSTWHWHRSHDKQFNQDVIDIQEATCDELEETMHHLGKQRTSFNFNDRIAYLRAHRPELYNPARKIIVEGYKMSESDAERRSKVLDNCVDATIVNAYTTRKERNQAKREGSSLLPSGDDKGGQGE